MSGIDPDTRLDEWIDQLRQWSDRVPQRTGTVAYVDTRARLRAAQAITAGEALSLARPLAPQPGAAAGPRLSTRFEQYGRVTVGFDELAVHCHGVDNTHLDALCHHGVDGEFFGGVPQAEANEALSVANWGAAGIVTRALYLDLPDLRGTPWVAPDAPVTGAELDQAVARTGVAVEPGDALVAYMGRDRFEAAGHHYRRAVDLGGADRPGLGRTAAEWIADHRISLLCWDFLDACGATETPRSVHMLIYGIGLALVDNCSLGGVVRDTVARHRTSAGMLTVAPLRVHGATGCLVNPLLVI